MVLALALDWSSTSTWALDCAWTLALALALNNSFHDYDLNEEYGVNYDCGLVNDSFVGWYINRFMIEI